jgi:hypothetical protein
MFIQASVPIRKCVAFKANGLMINVCLAAPPQIYLLANAWVLRCFYFGKYILDGIPSMLFEHSFSQARVKEGHDKLLRANIKTQPHL